MTRGLTPPSIDGEFSALKKRVTDLERKLDQLGGANLNLGLPFSLAGVIYASESPPWTPPHPVRIYSMVVLLGTAGTTNTVIKLRVNNTVKITLTLGPGETFRVFTTSISIAADQDIVTVECSSAGNGAQDLDVILRLK